MKWKSFTKRLLAIFLTAAMLTGILPLQSHAVSNDATINVEVGETFEDFAGSIPQMVVTCASCRGDLYTVTPDARSDYLNPTVIASNPGIVSDLGYGFKATTIASDPGHNYEAITLKFTGAKAGTTRITVSYQIHFQVPNLGNGVYECSDCGYPVTYYGYDNYDTITRTFTVNVTEPKPVETTYTLTYDKNTEDEVTGMPGTDTYKGTEDSHEFTVSAAVPSRQGYTFQGWADSADGEAAYLATDKITLTKDAPSKTLYAVWNAHEHQWTYTDNGDGTHMGNCSGCSLTDGPAAHTWNEGEITKPATAAEAGEKTYTCTLCGATKVEEIPAIEQETVQILVYRNGNTDKPYATYSLDGYAKGDTLDVSTLNIANYYSGTAEFAGWYNDGGWNTYKSGDPSQTISNPFTINGWTNIYCMVTDYENVSVYAVYDGDTQNAQRIYAGKALHGADLTAFLEENVTGLERDGYNLDKWYNWDWYGHKIGDNATVNGWTNVYVTYTANEYTLHFDVNGGIPEAEPVTVTYGKPYGELPAPTRTNYDFGGWALEDGSIVTAETLVSVAGDHTLKAVWTVSKPADPSGNNTSNELFKFRCTSVEEHEDQTYNWFGSYVKFNAGSLRYDEERGVYTATANITNVQTLLAFGTSCPNKVWGKTHYHTDENGNAIRTFTLNLVWNPDATGLNSSKKETTGLWLPDGEQIVNVWCYTAPAAPSSATVEKLDKIIWTHENYMLPEDGAKAGTRYLTSRKLIAGTYTIGEMYQEDGGFFCKLTITDLAPYIQAFNDQFATDTESYVMDTVNSPASYEYLLKYTGSKTDYKQDGTGWTVVYDNSSEKLNGKNLWMVHTPHNYGEWEIVKEATCTEDGERIRRCTHNAADKTRYCTATETEVIPATGHSLTHVAAVTPTCDDDGNIEYWYCADCGKYFTDEACTQEISVENTVIPAIGHNWEAVGKIDATCTTPEYITYQCGNDPHHIKQEVSGEALGHDYKTVVTAPTCTEGGYTTYTCEHCNETHVDDVTAPKGHSWNEGTTVTAPGCAQDGVMEYTCTECGAKKQENIGASGHQFEQTKHEPTCTECGWVTHTCSVCGYTYDSDHVAALGHDYEKTLAEPTCTGVGYTQYTCKHCDHSYTDNIVQPTGHKYETKVEEPTCTELGKTWEICSVCGDKRLIDTAPALGHDFSSKWTVDREPTCEEEGSRSHHCSRCDAKADTTVIPAAGHRWGEWTVTKAPTYTEEGEKSRTCTVCGKTETEKLAPIDPEPTEPEPTEPDSTQSDPTEPEPSESSQPGEPSEPSKPTEPTKPAEPDAPKTGDETNMGLMLCIMGVSLAGIVLLAFLLLKKNYSGKYLK